MLTYDELLIRAEDEGLTVKEAPLKSGDGRCKGRRIAIRQDIPTLKKKADVLAEEMGHYHTSVGNILGQNNTWEVKQEQVARLYAYNLRVGLVNLIDAYKAHCRNTYEIADYLNVSEEFLQEALERYRQKYGTGKMVNQYFVQFEPYLQVYEYQLIMDNG